MEENVHLQGLLRDVTCYPFRSYYQRRRMGAFWSLACGPTGPGRKQQHSTQKLWGARPHQEGLG